MYRFARVFMIFFLTLIFSACQVTNPTGTQKTKPAPPAPAAGKAVMTGQVLLKSDGKPIPAETPVRLAKITRQGSEGAFVLDTGHSPSSLSQGEGFFTIIDISPAEYLVVVGRPEDGNYVIYQDSEGKPVTFQIIAGKVIDLGVIKVDYNP